MGNGIDACIEPLAGIVLVRMIEERVARECDGKRGSSNKKCQMRM